MATWLITQHISKKNSPFAEGEQGSITKVLKHAFHCFWRYDKLAFIVFLVGKGIPFSLNRSRQKFRLPMKLGIKIGAATNPVVGVNTCADIRTEFTYVPDASIPQSDDAVIQKEHGK